MRDADYHAQRVQEVVRAREWAQEVKPGVYPAMSLPNERIEALAVLRERGITATPLAGGIIWLLEKLETPQ